MTEKTRTEKIDALCDDVAKLCDGVAQLTPRVDAYTDRKEGDVTWNSVVSRQITEKEAVKLGRLAWFIRGSGGQIVWYTNVGARPDSEPAEFTYDRDGKEWRIFKNGAKFGPPVESEAAAQTVVKRLKSQASSRSDASLDKDGHYRKMFGGSSTDELEAMLAAPQMPGGYSRSRVEDEVRNRKSGANKPIVTPQVPWGKAKADGEFHAKKQDAIAEAKKRREAGEDVKVVEKSYTNPRSGYTDTHYEVVKK